MEEQQSANPHALDSAQDPNEVFEIMEPPPANFDPYTDSPVSKMTFTTRGECHERGLWHCSVHIWIVDTASSSILLQKRSMKKDTFPGRVSHDVARYRIKMHPAINCTIIIFALCKSD